MSKLFSSDTRNAGTVPTVNRFAAFIQRIKHAENGPRVPKPKGYYYKPRNRAINTTTSVIPLVFVTPQTRQTITRRAREGSARMPLATHGATLAPPGVKFNSRRRLREMSELQTPRVEEVEEPANLRDRCLANSLNFPRND